MEHIDGAGEGWPTEVWATIQMNVPELSRLFEEVVRIENTD